MNNPRMMFNSVIPELSVADLALSLKFYQEVLDFKIEYARNQDQFAFLSYENILPMLELVTCSKNLTKV